MYTLAIPKRLSEGKVSMPKNDPLKNRLEELFSAPPEAAGRFSEETGEYSPITIQAELDQYPSITKVNRDQL